MFQSLPLPLEIATKIFLLCLPHDNRPMHPEDAPLLLTRVCRDWRELSLGIPRLWTNIHLPPVVFRGDSDHIDRLPTPTTLHTWLASSHPLPINITIDIRHQSSPRLREYPWPCRQDGIDFSYIREICACSERWSDARFLLADESAMECLSLALQGATLLVLEQLLLELPPSHVDQSHPCPEWTLSLFQRLNAAPKLQSLLIGNLTRHITKADTLLSPALRNYALVNRHSNIDFNMRSLIMRAQNCSHLTTLAIDLSPFVGAHIGGDIVPPVSLPHLQSLCLLLTTFTMVAQFLSSIRVPSLGKLTLNARKRSGTDRIGAMLGTWFLNNAPQLHTLTVSAHTIECHEIRSAIALIHRLNSLTVTDIIISEEMAHDVLPDLMLHFDGSGRLVSGQNPTLKHLRLNMFHGPRMQQEGSVQLAYASNVVLVVESRWLTPFGAITSDGQVVPRLSCFDMESGQDSYLKCLLQVYPEKYERLRMCWEEGLSRNCVC